jgi:excisionase family DNA binding protein
MEGDMEIYLTIAELAAMVKLSEQTIRRFVLNRTIPYRKIQKSVRFRLSEIERWIDSGSITANDAGHDAREGNLFGEIEAVTVPEAGPVESPDHEVQGEKIHD